MAYRRHWLPRTERAMASPCAMARATMIVAKSVLLYSFIESVVVIRLSLTGRLVYGTFAMRLMAVTKDMSVQQLRVVLPVQLGSVCILKKKQMDQSLLVRQHLPGLSQDYSPHIGMSRFVG